jgi:glycosyltransferase involved in cell wall biosynthesis
MMKKISIIIPAYNEEANIKKTVFDIVKNFKSQYYYEVVVVCDGCVDRTYERSKQAGKKYFQVKTYSYQKNRGKGYALTYGVKKAKGDVIAFYDAGGDFDIMHIDRFTKLMEVFDADIVIGSKRHPASKVNYPLIRKIYSKIYQILIKILFSLNIQDTQTGIKIFKKEVVEKILPRCVVKKYAFDLELLVIARKLGYKKIFEAPVNLNYNFNASGINYKSIWQMFTDTMGIFYRLNIIKYYDKIHLRITNKTK